ncbi:hypothetical protein CNECB9_2110014 [Cupriavidus necator]|uniref:Uncharacterized protein n=1 Tax=Cupriavidus necator TaxID=106590 RepID=A0A1K0IC86_CUPNE|nr:hypothetical protein CNECB9_2110014 [Cupriavidus necator]
MEAAYLQQGRMFKSAFEAEQASNIAFVANGLGVGSPVAHNTPNLRLSELDTTHPLDRRTHALERSKLGANACSVGFCRSAWRSLASCSGPVLPDGPAWHGL